MHKCVIYYGHYAAEISEKQHKSDAAGIQMRLISAEKNTVFNLSKNNQIKHNFFFQKIAQGLHLNGHAIAS